MSWQSCHYRLSLGLSSTLLHSAVRAPACGLGLVGLVPQYLAVAGHGAEEPGGKPSEVFPEMLPGELRGEADG